MMRNKDFCVFILTHGRADNVMTYNKVRKHGYTGRIYLVVDDEDTQLPRYKELYGDKVLVFSKEEASALFDPMDNFNEKRTITFARTYAFELAKQVGVRYFIELDDDYHSFTFRFTKEREFKERNTYSLDAIFDILIDFMKATPTQTIAMAQGGDFIGGAQGLCGEKIFLHRKAMNSFICDVERPFTFRGTFNEDVNTYLRLGNTGSLFFTNNMVCVHQGVSQQNKGGITEAYKRFGTYVKSFYSVMTNPTAVKVAVMGDTDKRIHHKVLWRHAVPKIVSEDWKKSR